MLRAVKISRKINGFITTSLLLTPNSSRRTYFIEGLDNETELNFKLLKTTSFMGLIAFYYFIYNLVHVHFVIVKIALITSQIPL